MATKTADQIRFEQMLEDNHILYSQNDRAIGEDGAYLSEEMALLMDVFTAGYNLGKEDGYTAAMADNDTLINP